MSVDAREGITTGISAADRARTIKTLVDSATEPWEITRPGHVFPLRAVPGGCCSAPGTPRPPSTWPTWPDSPRPA